MSGHIDYQLLPRRPSRSSTTLPSSRPARVEKPRSQQTSPLSWDRRKTTTETKLYATLDDHFRMMFGLESEGLDEERRHLSRPFSWHPSSTHFKPYQSKSYFESQYVDSPRHANHGSDFYSLSTRNSSYEPTTAHSTTTTPVGHGDCRDSERSENRWCCTLRQDSGYVHSTVNTPVPEPLPWYLHQWTRENQSQAQNRSFDFLPIQSPIIQDQEKVEEEGEKLVALGLYDVPEPCMTWTDFSEATGKGLKLEETWQPPENEDDGEADDASSVASTDDSSPPLPPVDEKAHGLHIPVHVKSNTPGGMEGQSFFFDDDESVSKEWWYQQLKQPSMGVGNRNLGCGWL